ncbi:hypothetical protein [Nocardia neocaledoniensis]|uniref:hypothetical protein n=1 Tax=Nocardia neocaledoniensis TaxID=236511 RepID=UPI002458EE98|nr:hypothetical protein [Nocardia neocaledoniensis]
MSSRRHREPARPTLTERLHAAAPALLDADVIGAHTALTDVIPARYDSARTADLELSA